MFHTSSGRARALAAVAGFAALGLAGPVAGANASITTYPNEATGAYVSWPDYLSGSTYSDSTYLVVPSVSCAGVDSGTFVGQSDYVDLNNSSGLEILADVRTYGDGATPTYDTEFVAPNASGTDVYSAGGIAVAPGQLVRLAVSDTAASSTASVFDVSTFKSASVTGSTLGSDVIGFVGDQGLQSDGSGGLFTSGPVPTGAGTLAGPVAGSAAIFAGTLIDGKSLAAYDAANDLGLDTWGSANGTPVKVSPFILDTFAITVTDPTTGGDSAAARPAVRGPDGLLAARPAG